MLPEEEMLQHADHAGRASISFAVPASQFGGLLLRAHVKDTKSFCYLC
jgi:hypothetical protein